MKKGYKLIIKQSKEQIRNRLKKRTKVVPSKDLPIRKPIQTKLMTQAQQQQSSKQASKPLGQPLQDISSVDSELRKLLVLRIIEFCHSSNMPNHQLVQSRAVRYLDAGLAQIADLTIQKAQLLAISCLTIAMKNEDRHQQSLYCLLGSSINVYTKAEREAMQAKLLLMMTYRLNLDSRFDFAFSILFPKQIVSEQKKGLHQLVVSVLELSLLKVWEQQERELGQAGALLAGRIFKRLKYTGSSQRIHKIIQQLKKLWRENQSILPYLQNS